MSLPPVRAIVLSVASALAAFSFSAQAAAASSALRLDLESVTRLDPARANPGEDAVSIVYANRIEGSPDDELNLIGDAEVRRGGA